MMIVTEYLPQGDLRAFLKIKGALPPATAVRFALDIARDVQILEVVPMARHQLFVVKIWVDFFW
jgi:hypothetical protein